MAQAIKTTDLYLTAFLLTQNIAPAQVVAEGQNRRKVTFVFASNEKTAVLAKEFASGEATAKVSVFARQLEFVRDVMFSKLRE
jgi:hypothetical protein